MPEFKTQSGASDGELLFRLSRGDEPSYRLLHDRHQAAVYRLALILMRSTWDAEEVAATAFFELWRKRDKVRLVDGSILPWLLATTSYSAKNSQRSGRRYQRLLNRIPHDGDVPDHADEVAHAMDFLRVSQDVRDALLKVPARDAAVLVLCVIHELPMHEAAVALGVPEGTVKSRLSRAKTRLRGTLERYSPTTKEAQA